MNYQECLEWMFSQLPAFQRIGKAAYKDNLDNTYAIMDVLGDPHLKFKSIHVAGTNGKGSTSHLLASAFQEAGYKVGLYTSPHLRDFRERIRINGEMIPEESVLDFIQQNKDAFEEIKPSFFEMTVGMAFHYFAQEKVDIAILETGMGGRLDSTNIVRPELSVITNIGLDHTQFLGDTLGKIAIEKAGIIKTNVPVIIGETQEEIQHVFLDKAKSLDAPLYFADQEYRVEKEENEYSISGELLKIHLQVPLYGDYQQKNILTAFAACREMGLDLEKIMLGFNRVIENTGFKGRWEILGHEPKVICDTAHNEAGLSFVMKQLRQENYEKLHIVLGVVDDKNLDAVLGFFPKTAQYYFCKADIPRGLDANVLQQKAIKFSLIGSVYSSVQEAYQNALSTASSQDLVFIGGSTFTVAEVV